MSAQAAPDAAQRCVAAKLAAAGREGATLLRCDARVAQSPPDCATSASASRAGAFATAESGGQCLTSGDSTAIGAEVEDLRSAIRGALRPDGSAESRCANEEIAAAARALKKLAHAYVRAVRHPDGARLSQQIAGATAQLERSFARASTRGDCVSATSADEIATLLGDGAAHLHAKLEPSCGDGVQAGSEECDGAGCSADDPDGCSDGCTCCASAAPCYERGIDGPFEHTVPCCSGVCNIPGPEAGPNVVVYCTPPADACPCWTTATLDATFPPGYFDQQGRGGASCDPEGSVGVVSNDTCLLPQPIGEPSIEPARAGAGVLTQGVCVLLGDLDPANDGQCDQPPTVVGTTPAQTDSCIVTLRASAIYQASCP